MNSTTCNTRICTIEELNPGLKASLKAHVKQHGLESIEPTVLMCCETKSILQKNGLFGGKETSLSAAYLTPTMLVWAVAANGHPASVGSAQLWQIEARDYESTAMFALLPNQGVNITGRYTGGNRTGMTFISLGSEPAGQNFRKLLKESLSKAAR